MNMQGAEVFNLQIPVLVATSATGSYVDLIGIIGKEVKAVLLAGVGTTAGTCGGTIQTAEDTSGTGVATALTFAGLTSAGGAEEKHFAPKAGHRYARFMPTSQSGKSMLMSCVLVAQTRYRP